MKFNIKKCKPHSEEGFFSEFIGAVALVLFIWAIFKITGETPVHDFNQTPLAYDIRGEEMPEEVANYWEEMAALNNKYSNLQ